MTWRARIERCFQFATGSARDGAPATGKATRELCVPATDLFGALDPHGKLLAIERDSAGAHDVVLTAGKTTRVELDMPKLVNASPTVAFSSDGGWLLGYTVQGYISTLWVWDASTGKRRDMTASPSDGPPAFEFGDGPPHRKGFWAADVSADGKLIAVGGEDTVTIYNLADGKPRRTVTVPGPGYVTAVALYAGGLAIGTSDGRLAISRDSGGALDVSATASDGGAIRLLGVATTASGPRRSPMTAP